MRVDLRPAVSADGSPAAVAVPPAWASGSLDRATRARGRLAWAILWLSFLSFCALTAVAVLGVSWYRERAMSARFATLEIHGGTVLHQPEDAVRETVAADKMHLEEGDRIRTDANGRALLTLPDGSNLQLWPDTQVEVRQLRSSTYNNNRAVTVLAQHGGHSRVEVALPQTVERRFEIQTPSARALLREGSYRVEQGLFGTDLSVRTGSASVTAKDQTIELLRGERTLVAPNGSPAPPIAAARNLVRNGDFVRGFEGWQQGSRNEEDGVPGAVSLVEQDGRFAVRMRRQGSHKHGETFVHQTINRDVTDEVKLRLSMDVKVVDQTLSGGGWRGSEYPLLVRLRYRDAYGSESTVVRGYFVKNPDGHPTTNGTQVPANQWLPMTLDLFDDRAVAPRPTHLLWLEVEGAGWDYESLVTGIQLLAE